MKKVSNLICLSVLLVLGSCNSAPSQLTPKEFVSYIEADDRGCSITQTAGDFQYKFLYKPAEYIAIREKGDLNVERIENRRAELKNTVWFNVQIKAKDNINPLKRRADNMEEYNRRLNYFLMKAGSNFTLYYDNVEAQQIGYFFENNYGLSPGNVMIVGFKIPDIKPVKEMRLHYDDELFKYGFINITVTPETLANIPSLKI